MPSLQPLSLSLSRAAAAAARGGPREGGLAGPPRRDLGPADLSVGPPPGPPPGPSLGGPPRQGSGPTGERREPPPAGEGGKRGSGPRPPGLPGDSLGQPRGRGGDPSIFPHIPPVLSRYQPGLRARGGWPRRSRSLGSASVSLAGPRGEGGRAGPRGGIRAYPLTSHIPPGSGCSPPRPGPKVRPSRGTPILSPIISPIISPICSTDVRVRVPSRNGPSPRPGEWVRRCEGRGPLASGQAPFDSNVTHLLPPQPSNQWTGGPRCPVVRRFGYPPLHRSGYSGRSGQSFRSSGGTPECPRLAVCCCLMFWFWFLFFFGSPRPR